jgi:uncharacterized protein
MADETSATVNVADPAPLGLAAFAMTTFALSSANAHLFGEQGLTPALALAIFYGGLGQLIAGMWEFFRKNTFGALAFTSYGGFWLAFWYFATQLGGTGAGVFLLGWTIFTAYMFIASTRVSVAVMLVFALLTLTFLFLTLGGWNGANHVGLTKTGGWLGIATAVVAWYTSMAGVTNSTWGKTVFPVGPRG